MSPEIRLDWVDTRDLGWIAEALAVLAACDGLRVREVQERLRRARVIEAGKKWGLVEEVLWAMSEVRPGSSDARALRARLFTGADGVVEEVARELGVDVPEVWDRAFGDLPSERTYVAPPAALGVTEVAERANLRMVQRVVAKAVRVRIVLWGNAHDVVRHVRLQGLLCVARRVPEGVELEISGVYSLFRRTTLYGRAMASVVPRLRWCARYALEAECVVGEHERVLRHGPRDPVWAAAPPRRFDSRLEERFERDWRRAFPDFGIVRNPEAIDVGGRLIFPDFAVWRVGAESVRWLVEIVGWWTPSYLSAKVEAFRRAGLEGVVLCVDEARNLGEGDWPSEVKVVRFAKRVPVDDVRRAIEAAPGGTRRIGASVAHLGEGQYFLDWAGRRAWNDAVHERIARLRPGTEAKLEVRDGLLCVVVEDGPVAALSASARRTWEPRLPRVTEVWVRAVAERRRDRSGAAWRERLRVERWLVPLVDITWHPG